MSKTPITSSDAMALARGITPYERTGPLGKAPDARRAAGEAIHHAANAVGDAARATGDYLTELKDAAVKAAQKRLDRLDTRWQTLQARATSATGAAKADLHKAKVRMAKTLAAAKARLVEAKNTGADAWQQDLKPALDATLQKVRKYSETL